MKRLLIPGATLVVLSACECPPGDTYALADGGTAGGVDPVASAAPFLVDHVATVTWGVPQTASPLHLDEQRTSNPSFQTDCKGHIAAFLFSYHSHVFTEDGLISLTRDGEMQLGPDGTPTNPTWTDYWRQGRPVTGAPSWWPPNFELDIHIPIVNLKPGSSTIELVDSPLGSPPVIGVATFVN